MTRLRMLVGGLATLGLSLLGLLGATPAQACACGGFVAADGERVAASAEYAALTWDGSTERVLLSMNTLSDTADAALLLPMPSPAKASLASSELFAQLESVTAPTTVAEWRWWPTLGEGVMAGAAPGSSAGAPVSVVATQRLGHLEVTTLAASDAKALTTWLHDHGYVMRAGLAKALEPYVAKGWYYTAIRLSTDAKDLSGTLQPLDLRFTSDVFVYPMRLSAAATSSQFVRTYVFADHQMRRSDPTAAKGSIDVRFAGRIDPSAVSATPLPSIVADHPYLTVLDQYFSNPPRQIVSDFTFAAAESDVPYRRVNYQVRTHTIAGLPAGPVLVVLGVVTVNAAAVGIVLLQRRRRRRT